MPFITQLLNAAAQGDRQAADEILPLVYDELRRLATQKMAREKPGHTLDATALVHEAYLRLVLDGQGASSANVGRWQGRGHFFGAAAEAMRRILVDSARRKQRECHGGDRQRVTLTDVSDTEKADDNLIALDEVLTKFAAIHADAAQIVKLRYFVGLSVEQAGETLGISRTTAYRHWDFARAWLRTEMQDDACRTA